MSEYGNVSNLKMIVGVALVALGLFTFAVCSTITNSHIYVVASCIGAWLLPSGVYLVTERINRVGKIVVRLATMFIVSIGAIGVICLNSVLSSVIGGPHEAMLHVLGVILCIPTFLMMLFDFFDKSKYGNAMPLLVMFATLIAFLLFIASNLGLVFESSSYINDILICMAIGTSIVDYSFSLVDQRKLPELNTARAEDLINAVAGVGRKTAGCIVAHRDDGGIFETVDDLDGVLGFDPNSKGARAIKVQVRVSAWQVLKKRAKKLFAGFQKVESSR